MGHPKQQLCFLTLNTVSHSEMEMPLNVEIKGMSSEVRHLWGCESYQLCDLGHFAFSLWPTSLQ